MSSYDRAGWHYGGDFPGGLPPENGGTHIGMFLAWCIMNNLQGEFHDRESAGGLEAVRERGITGREFLMAECDEKFGDEDLDEEGNRFARAYYEITQEKEEASYLSDYERILSPGLPSLYHVADTWENYDMIAPVISARYQHWRTTGNLGDPSVEPKKSWWRFW